MILMLFPPHIYNFYNADDNLFKLPKLGGLWLYDNHTEFHKIGQLMPVVLISLVESGNGPIHVAC